MTPAQKAKQKKLLERARKALLDPQSPGWMQGTRAILADVARLPHKGVKDCPFCGDTPTGKKFCSTPNGPALICDSCGCQGPPSNGRQEYVFKSKREDKNLENVAVWVWNWRADGHRTR